MKVFRSRLFACVAVILIAAQMMTNVALAKPSKQPALAAATGPLRVNPANGRYFTDGSGRAILLTGSHTWDNRQDLGTSSFDYAGYLTRLQQYHHNFFRFWVWEQPKGITTSPNPAQPNATLKPEIFKRTGPGTAADGGLKFDVNQYNQTHFDRLRQRTIDAGNKGMYVAIMLFDGWSVEQKAGGANPWVYHPFNRNNNINGLNGDPNGDQSGAETHTLQIAAIRAAQEAYVRKVIDTVNDLDNVLYEVSNESGTASTAWQYHVINYVHQYEATKPKQHPVGMTAEWPGGVNSELFASPADWISPNGNDGYGDTVPSATGNKVVILDTDHIWGIGGDRVWAWKSFTRGYNLLYMDPWNGTFIPAGANESLRQNLGYILTYAERMNLQAATPQPSLCSTGYCLARAVASGAQYLSYLPSGGSITVNLSAAQGSLAVEWFNPSSGTTTNGGTVSGGSSRSFTAPFGGDAVLYLYATTSSATNTPPATNPPASPTSSGGTIRIGETNILPTDDSGNGNLLVAQQTTLSQSATIQSMSFYVATAAGQLRLGIYDDAGGRPGTLKAQTAAFTPAVGWHMQNVQTPVLLPAGSYWLVYLPQSSSLHFRVDRTTGSARYYSYTFGPMPSTFSSSATSGTFHFSFYATLNPGTSPTSVPTATGTAAPNNTPTRTPTAFATSVKIGETNVLGTDDSGDGNRLVAQQTTLSQSATIQSMSFYITSAVGRLRLGIYNDAGGRPGTLQATTGSFVPVVGWNTRNVLTPVLLPAGTYWLAYLPESNDLHFRADPTSGSARYYNYTYGPMPSTFASPSTTGVFHVSFYATLTR